MKKLTLTAAAVLGLAALPGPANDAEASDLEFVVYAGDAYVRYVHDDRHDRVHRYRHDHRKRYYRDHAWRKHAHSRWHWHNDGRRDRYYHRDHRRLHRDIGLAYCNFHRREIWHR